MKNKLTDLNNHLFEQLERLNNEDLKGDELESEVKRAKAISDIAGDIISNASIQLNALKMLNDTYYNPKATQKVSLQLLGCDNNEQDV